MDSKTGSQPQGVPDGWIRPGRWFIRRRDGHWQISKALVRGVPVFALWDMRHVGAQYVCKAGSVQELIDRIEEQHK